MWSLQSTSSPGFSGRSKFVSLPKKIYVNMGAPEKK